MDVTPDHPQFSFEAHGGFRQSSDASIEYNCIAWAAGDTSKWWWPDPLHQYYWPDGVDRRPTLDAFAHAFSTLGYSPCEDARFEPGSEKVAIFTKDNAPTHAARLLAAGPDAGGWTSKMGRDIDIVHALDGVGGGAYGSVALVLRRPAPHQ